MFGKRWFNKIVLPAGSKQVLLFISLTALFFQIVGFFWHAHHSGILFLHGILVFALGYLGALVLVYTNRLVTATHWLMILSNLNMLYGFTIFNSFTGFTSYFFTFIVAYSLIFGMRQIEWFFFYSLISITVFLIHKSQWIFLFVDRSVSIRYNELQELFFYVTSMIMAALVLFFQASSLAKKDLELNARLIELDSRSEDLHKALREKEILLAEVYHRVKNNLTVVLSLISLQRNLVNDERIESALLDCSNRIKSMAMIHQKFYQEGNFETIDLKKYVHELIDELKYAYNTSEFFQTTIDMDAISVDLKTAIPLGIIINEAVTNSIKHGCDDTGNLVLALTLKSLDGNRFRMLIQDQGPGFDFSDNRKMAGGLGLVLIESLSEQIDGTVSFNTAGGTCLELVFPLRKGVERKERK